MNRARSSRIQRAALVALALFAAAPAVPHSLTVPFFRDEGGTMANNGPVDGGAALITVTNTRNQPVTMYLVYAQNDLDEGVSLQQAVPWTLGARESLSWRPAQDDPAEGAGRNVPNVLPGLSSFGSVVIYWIGGDEMTGALIGQYREFTSSRAMMHVLVEQRN